MTASLLHQGQSATFSLTFRGETVSLTDPAALNHWAAIGIVERHTLHVSDDGIVLDGHRLQYTDPQATERLEQLVNRPQTAPKSQSHPPGQAKDEHRTATGFGKENWLATLADSLRVTREGFEFRVTFRTRFGETKTERLQPALELFQNMRAFKPHVSLQKSGIRLVVTRWDGDTFFEEPGIENVEHASTDEVETLIRKHLQGSPDVGASGSSRQSTRTRSPVVGLTVAKKPHDSRFHLLVHRQNGKVEDGPVLIRNNMAKLVADHLIDPGVTLSMTAFNDRITVTRQKLVDGQTVVVSDTLPLLTAEDAQRLQEILRDCLPPIQSEESALASSPATALPIVSAQASISPVSEPAEIAEPQDSTPDIPPVESVDEDPRPDALPETTLVASPELDLHSRQDSAARRWIQAALTQAAALPAEQVNEAIFKKAQAWFRATPGTNDHDLPAFEISSPARGDSPSKLGFVLSPHYLLCTTPFGYVRFGPETRFFLTRLDDYMLFPHHALRGLILCAKDDGLAFVVSGECADLLRAHSEHSYATQFASLVRGTHQVSPSDRLLWPVSDEERLFELVAQNAGAYGLPVTADTVTLDPSGSIFVGFKRVPYGMEFRDGEEFVRFSPTAIHVHEEDRDEHLEIGGLLCGWALDDQGHLCAFYRPANGFEPPGDLKLLHFIPQPAEPGAEFRVLGTLG